MNDLLTIYKLTRELSSAKSEKQKLLSDHRNIISDNTKKELERLNSVIETLTTQLELINGK